MSANQWYPTFNIATIRQSLTTGSGAFGGIGFSTIDDSNNSGQYDAARIAVINNGGNTILSGTALAFYTQVGGISNTNPATEHVRITSAGNVGIGTTAPAFKLHLYEATANPQIRIQNGSTGAIDITPTSINSGQHLAISASSYLLLASTTNDIIHRAVMSHKFENNSGSEWMRITSAGNVGIGTSAPTGRIEIADSGAVNGRLLYLNSSTGLAGGQTGPLYGLYSDVVGNNNATSAYGGYLYGNAPSGSSYGIFGEAFQASSTRDGIGVVGKAITNSASTNHRSDRGLGLGPVAGVYAITGTTGTSLVAQTTALHALNTTVYGAESYGAWIETVAGPTSIVPLKVVHAGTEIFRVGSNGDVLVNGITVGRGLAAVSTNTAVGVTALAANTTGNSNVAVGHEALFSNTTGVANTATGLSALRANTGGTANTATGRNALLANTTGLGNTAIGLGALVANTTGSYNTCIGHDSGQALTTGSNNTIIGRIAGTAGLADTVIIGAGTTERLRIDSTGNVGIGTSTPGYKLEVNGSFAATTKSFVIGHPTQEGMKLRYGSLESPYHGVRLTGEAEVINGVCVVELPDYICGLCKQEGSQVQITNIRHGKVLWVDSIDVDNNEFAIATEETGNYKFYWSFTAIRKDVEDMIVEFEE